MGKENLFEMKFIYSIHELYFLISKKFERKFVESKVLTFSQFWVMHCLIECGLDMENSQVEIAKEMFVSEATISKHISNLENQGFIKKSIDLKSRRRHILLITDKGKEIYEKSNKILHSELKKIFKNIKKQDQNKILQNLNKVLTNIYE